MTDSAEKMRAHKYAALTLVPDGYIWTAGIDIRKNNGDWHYNAVECHSVDRELAIARRDTVFAALSASGMKSDGGAEVASSTALATKGEPRGNSHGMMPVGDNAETVVCTDRSPSDPITSEPDEREAIARLEPVAWQLRYAGSNHPWFDAKKVNTDSDIEWRGLVPVAQAEAHAAEQVQAERERIAAWHDEQAAKCVNERLSIYEAVHRRCATAIRARGQV